MALSYIKPSLTQLGMIDLPIIFVPMSYTFKILEDDMIVLLGSRFFIMRGAFFLPRVAPMFQG